MDDFDDWLRDSASPVAALSIPLATSTQPTGPLTTPASSSSIDDSMDALLASVISLSPAMTSTTEIVRMKPDPFDEFDINSPLGVTAAASASVEQTSKPSNADHSDFLAWLDDTESSPSSTPTPAPPAGPGRGVKSLNLTPLVLPKTSTPSSAPTPSTVSNLTVNSFFDEVFGGVEDPVTISVPSLISDQQSQAKTTVVPITPVEIEAEINDTLESAFPDVERLRKLLLSCGRIPSSYRGKVWCLLLNGFYVEDQEAKEYRVLESDLSLFGELVSDCNAAAYHSPSVDAVACRTDLIDLTALYCMRKETAYHHILCQILTPIITAPHRMSRGLAYSCFYSLCSKFIPLINLQTDAFNGALTKLCDWLRLLVVYHYPALAMHLDRVVPGWERIAADASVSSSKAQAANMASSAGLDDLEAELGFGLGTGSPIGGSQGSCANGTKIFTTSDAFVIESARPVREIADEGLIPLHWICGLFAGSIPPEQACVLWDWILLTENRFAGIYLTAAMLGIFSQSLISMTGSDIKLWMQKVAVGSDDWFRLAVGTTAVSKTTGPLSWSTFLRGWMYAAEALKQTTPISFVNAIELTEEWAVNSTNDTEHFDADDDSGAVGLDDESHTRNDENTGSSSHKIVGTSTLSNSEPSDDDKTSATMASKLVTIHAQSMDIARQKLRRFSEIAQEKGKLWIANLQEAGIIQPSTNAGSSSGRQRNPDRWLHDSLKNSVCLWTDTSEVVPCLCSNRRKPSIDPNNSISSYYSFGVNIEQAEVGDPEENLFPIRNSYGVPENIDSRTRAVVIEPPFYFGIDCRNEEEKSLGRFPKAFNMNANFIVDSEEVSILLETLQPIANTVHICIFGVGTEAIRQKALAEFVEKRKKSVWEWDLDERDREKAREKEEQEIFRLVEEELAKLNGAAMFFVKRGFSKISILNGGFMSAAKYLLREDTSLTVESALVDVDESSMCRLLSPSSKDKMPTREQALPIAETNSSGTISSFVAQLSAKLQPGVNPSVGSVKSNNSTDDLKCNSSGSVLLDLTKKLGLFGAGILSKASSGTVSDQAHERKGNSDFSAPLSSASVSFVIDGDDDDDDGSGHGSSSHGVSVNKSEQEKKQALAMHRLSGIVRGEKVRIDKDSLPGAILFPAFLVQQDEDTDSAISTAVGITVTEPVGAVVNEVVPAKTDHRYLVITRDRFIVLDSRGEGVGADAIVKSNNHLTELNKMTFRKRDPELVTLFFMHEEVSIPDNVSESEVKEMTGNAVVTPDPDKPLLTLKTTQFRIPKRKEFVEVLQKSMQRFK